MTCSDDAILSTHLPGHQRCWITTRSRLAARCAASPRTAGDSFFGGIARRAAHRARQDRQREHQGVEPHAAGARKLRGRSHLHQRFFSSFKPVKTGPWQGVLERQRFECVDDADNPGQKIPEAQEVRTDKGDSSRKTWLRTPPTGTFTRCAPARAPTRSIRRRPFVPASTTPCSTASTSTKARWSTASRTFRAPTCSARTSSPRRWTCPRPAAGPPTPPTAAATS